LAAPDRADERPRLPLGRRLVDWSFGPPRIARLTVTHCVHSVAESFFTVSLAGSIFFSVSPNAARPRVLLFLVVTLAPFLVMAPLVGPIIDRIRGGLATALTVTFVIRALLALLLAQHLRDVFLFPLAFGVLLTAKTYTVSRNAMVPLLVDDEDDLVAANARLSRTATFAGALGSSAAFAIYAAASADWALRMGAVVYVIGAFVAWRVRAVASPIDPIDQRAIFELVQRDVSGAVWDMMVLRAAGGFALFQFGFSLRADGEPVWLLGAIILANAIGGFSGTVIAPWMRAHLTERSMFTAALVTAALAAAICGLLFSPVSLVLSMVVLGLSVSVGRRALDATIQRQAPHARRGRVYAGIETRLELAWVLAACLAVALRVASWVGILGLAGFLLIFASVHLRRRSGLGVLRPVASAPLPERLLMRAETLAAHGFHDEAFVLAQAAAELIDSPPSSDAEVTDDLERRTRSVIERTRARLTP
jgi:hypothetical protein